MNLKKQKILMDHFLKNLEKEVASAKRSGTYDIGIKTVTGHSVSIEKPRAFCFRGLEGKDEQVLLYKVIVDGGMESSVALDIYNEAMAALEGESGSNSNNNGSGFFGGATSRGIKTGFYFDKRKLSDGSPMFKETKKRVYLIINQGRASRTCIVARPNYGKFLASKDWVRENLLNGPPKLSLVTNNQQAIDVWDQEFKLADLSNSETYQRYCHGRHRESFVFSGSVVPILNKILVAANPRDIYSSDQAMTMPAIVRVEPSGKTPPEEQAEGASNEGTATGAVEETTDSSAAESANDTESAEPAVGQKVAIEMLGSSIFRGTITEYKEDGGDNADDENQSGTYVATFTNGSNIELSVEEAKDAMKLFSSEVEKLMTSAKMPKADASNTKVHAAICSSTRGPTRRPVLAEGEENDTEEVEKIYEEEYDGDVPKVLVGLEFQRAPVKWYSEKEQKRIEIPFWQFVLRSLAEKCRGAHVGEKYVLSSRELLNLEKAEAMKGEN